MKVRNQKIGGRYKKEVVREAREKGFDWPYNRKKQKNPPSVEIKGGFFYRENRVTALNHY